MQSGQSISFDPFNISMPVLYGEGNHAFQRLEIEILQKYPEESILAWQEIPRSLVPVLAKSPNDFEQCLNMQPNGEWLIDQDPDPRRENPPGATSWVIELRANAKKLESIEVLFVGGEHQSFL